MLSLDFSFVCIFVGFAHFTESRVLILSQFKDDPVLDRTEETSLEKVPLKHLILPDTSKRIRNSKNTIVRYGRNIYNLDDFNDREELRSKLRPESIAYDYVDIDKLIRSTDSARNDVKDFLKDILLLSKTPLRVCYGRQCEGDFRKSSKKYKKHDDGDETDWKHKKMKLPLHMKRFQIVDNKHNSVRDPKFGSEEKQKQKSKPKEEKENSSESKESKESGSEERDSGRSHKKDFKDSASASFEKWKNHEEDLTKEEVITKKNSKKKKKHIEEPDKRKTIPVEETYFVQGNKIYLSNGKSKKKHDKRRRLEHFLPKRYHWDPADIHELGYYWFNGPKGLYPEPRPLSI